MVWILAAVMLLAAGPARAHGILQGSSPAANTVLPSPPPEVVLAFTEPVDEAFSGLEVVGPSGRPVGGPAQISAGGVRVRSVLDEGLGPGAYTVRWRVLSRVDGHVTSGAFVFAVGAQPPPAGPEETGERVVPSLAATRWLSLLTALLLAGAVLFQTLILRPVSRLLAPETALAVREAALPVLDTLRVAAAGALLIAVVFEFAAHSAAALGGTVAPLLRRAILGPLLADTRAGWSLLARILPALVLLAPARGPWRILAPAALVWFLVVTAVIAVLGGPAALRSTHVSLIVLVGTVYALVSVIASIILPAVPDLRIPEGRWIRPAAAVLLLGGFTLTSHAVSGGPAAVAVDWLHLIAAAGWIGGLPALLLVLRALPAADRMAAGRLLVPRVSRVALASLVVLVLTGLIAARRTVGDLSGLTASLYGGTLLVKLGLVLIAALLGALNRFVLRPRVEAGVPAALDRFRRSVSAEVALGAVILLAVGVLTTVPPASVTRTVRAAPTITLGGIAGPWRVRLSISPAAPGWNDVQAAVRRETGQPVEGAHVQVILRALDHAEDRAFDLPPTSDGYAASGDFLARGWWEVTVIVRAEGRTDQTSFPLMAGDAASPAASAEARRLLDEVRREMLRHRSWREIEQISDGSGNVVRTQFEAQAPDRLAYRTSGGAEAVIIGAVRYVRDRGGTWTRDILPQSLALDGPLSVYFDGASEVRLGRDDDCDGAPCRVVLWELPRSQAQFAARVALRTGTILMLAMVAPDHYMIARPFDLGAPIRITPPP